MTELKHELDAVIRNLEARPWIQGAMNKGGSVCAHGAVMTCKGLAPGDADIIRAVIRDQGLTENWNDIEGRTKEEVLERFRSIEVTDTALADTFGPQWRAIVALVRRAAILTEDEAKALNLNAARDAARFAARIGAWGTSRTAARDAGAAWVATRTPALAAAQAASQAAARDATQNAAWGAARDAALSTAQALAARDLIGDVFTQAHYDALTGPWSRVVGKVHPDDATEELNND